MGISQLLIGLPPPYLHQLKTTIKSIQNYIQNHYTSITSHSIGFWNSKDLFFANFLSKKKLEKIAHYFIDVKIEFFICLFVFLGMMHHRCLVSFFLKVYKEGNLLCQDFSYIWNKPIFYNILDLKYYLLHKDSVFSFYIFSNFFFTLCFFFTDFENFIFHKSLRLWLGSLVTQGGVWSEIYFIQSTHAYQNQ